MTTSTSLIQVLMDLLRDPRALADFQDDPSGYLANCGVPSLTPADVRDALTLIGDNQDADGSREHHSGGNHVHVPPPPAPRPEAGESPHDAAVRYLNTYVTNNYIDDRDTTVDNSVHQQVDTHGGDFNQDIDTHSTVVSGDGAVGAGGDISGSTVVTGDDDQVGDGNVAGNHDVVGHDNHVVQGNDDTTAFGAGDASSAHVQDAVVDRGGALSVGGDATGHDAVTNSYDHTSSTTDTSTTVDHSYDEHQETSVSETHHTSDVHDSHDETHTDSGSHNDVHIDAGA